MSESGYSPCACRDCFDVAVSNDIANPDLCGLCADAGCDEEGESACERDHEEEDAEHGPDIADDDVRLDHIPDVDECAELLAKFERAKFWPNVWHINERGNVDLLNITGKDGATIVRSWV